MTEIETKHAAMVAALVKDPERVRDSLERPGAMRMLYVEMSNIIFRGARLDAVKKFLVYEKPCPTHQQALEACAASDAACQLPFQLWPQHITSHQAALLHAAIGISGEAVELLGAVYEHVFADKPLDIENCTEECGDLEFFLDDLRRRIGISREETLEHNMAKLAKRYPNYQYTDQRAQERADKEPGQ